MSALVTRIYDFKVPGLDDNIKKAQLLTEQFAKMDEAKKRLNIALKENVDSGDETAIAAMTNKIKEMDTQLEKLGRRKVAAAREAALLARAELDGAKAATERAKTAAIVTKSMIEQERELDRLINLEEKAAKAERLLSNTRNTLPSNRVGNSPNVLTPIDTSRTFIAPSTEMERFTLSLQVNTEEVVKNNMQISANKQAQAALSAEITKNGRATDDQIEKLAELRQQRLILDVYSKELAMSEKNITRELIAQKGSLEQLTAQLASLRLAYDRLGASEREAAEGKELVIKIKEIDGAVKALEANTGRFQRNVGNYKDAYSGLNVAIQQILRETPAAAVSLNTFFLAISNNLPMLFDELAKTKQQVKEFTDAIAIARKEEEIAAEAFNRASASRTNVGNSLERQIETALAAAGASKEQTVAIREQIAQHVAAGTATAEHTEQLLINAGASTADAAAIGRQTVISKEATIATNLAKTALDAKTAATEKSIAASAGMPSVMKGVVTSLLSLQTFLTLGVLALTLFGGKVIEVFSELFSGSKKLESSKKILESYNEVTKDANKSIAEQLNTLKLLYKSATDVNVPLNQRLLYVQQLKKEFPEYFANLSNEAILNNLSKDSYEKLTKSIIESARARAAKSKIDALAAQQLDLEFQKQKINNAINNENRRAKDVVFDGDGAGIAYGFTKEDVISMNEAKRKEAIKAQDDQKRILQDQIDFLTKFAGGEEKLARAILNTNKIKENSAKGADKLSAEEKNRLNEIEAVRRQGIAEEEAKWIKIQVDHDASIIEEKKYYENIKNISLKAIDDKIKHISSQGELNAAEKLQLSEFQKQKQEAILKYNNDIKNIDKRDLKESIDILSDEMNAKIDASNFKNLRVQDDPFITTLEKVNAEKARLEEILSYRQIFAEKIRSLQTKFGEIAEKDLKEANERVESASRDAMMATVKQQRELYEERYIEIKRFELKAINELNNKYIGLTEDIEASNISKGSKKDALKKLDISKEIDKLRIEMEAAQQRYNQAKADFETNPNKQNEEAYARYFLSLSEKAKELSDSLDKSKESITSFAQLAQKALRNVFDIKKDGGLDALLGETIVKSFDLATQVMNNFFDAKAQRVQEDKQRTYDQIELQRAQALSQAQTLSEREEIEKQAVIKRKQADKQAFEESKKIQKAQAAVNLATQLSNLAVIAFAPNPLNIATLGTAGAIMYAVQAGLALAGYFSNVARINAASYATGGKVQTADQKPVLLQPGRIIQQPNVPQQSNGDNILAFVRRGEVILNEDQQRKALQIGGGSFFSKIGVPGFAEGGFTGIGNLNLGDSLNAPLNPSSFLMPSQNNIEQMNALVKLQKEAFLQIMATNEVVRNIRVNVLAKDVKKVNNFISNSENVSVI